MKIRIEFEVSKKNSCSRCFCLQKFRSESGDVRYICRAFERVIETEPITWNGVVTEYKRCRECVNSEIKGSEE